jgi:putative tricarboxylic transport membrane protein
MSGTARFTFGNMYMLDGIAFISVAVGLFAIPEVLVNVEEVAEQVFMEVKLSLKNLLPSRQDWKDSAGALTRGTLIGFMAGALPGAGATVSTFLAYAAEKKLNKNGHLLGTGHIAGVAAPESANNAAAGGAMIHLLTLGLPGSATTAIMMGALIVHGLRPGPLLFQEKPEFVWGLIASMYVGNAMLLVLNLPLVGLWVSLLKVPYRILMPLILMIATVGVYATDNNMFQVWTMVVFGAIGYALRKLDFPAAPVVLALVMGPLVERALRQSLTMSHGNLSIFATRPIAAVLLSVAFISLAVPLIRALWNFTRAPKPKVEPAA